MSKIDMTLIEHYQKIYEKDPKSKIFASLAEAYRKMNITDQAFEIAKRGVVFHPEFIGGLVALGRSAIKLKKYDIALENLEKACKLSKENILAQQLLGEVYLLTKQPKLALKAFKQVLFFNPKHPKALKAVKKLESLTADEFESDVFQMSALENFKNSTKEPLLNEGSQTANQSPELERHLSIIDALISRNEIERADVYLGEAQKHFSGHAEITKRLLILQHRQHNTVAEIDSPEGAPLKREQIYADDNIKYLESLLEKIKHKT